MATIAPGDVLIRYIDGGLTIMIENGHDFDLEIVKSERTAFGFRVVFIKHGEE